MQDLLKEASKALSGHDADTLERLAVEARAIQAVATHHDTAAVKRMTEVLRQQVAAASSHLALRQRLSDTAIAGAQSWAR